MKELNFKDWLEKQGVDTKLFWKNCKKKHQRWCLNSLTDSRSKLVNEEIIFWLGNAFAFENALQKDVNFRKLSNKWERKVCKAKKKGRKIVFGF